MSVYKFTSADLGATLVAGTAGSFISAILDPCLVNGFGSVAVSSMTRSGSVVTVTTSAPHGFYYAGQSTTETASVVRISGANETGYNGDWKVVTVVSTTVFTFNIGAATPASPATGTITSLRAPLGWTKPYSGTNKAAYKQPAGTNQHYLRIDNNTPTGGDVRSIAVRGYETMSDVDTGTGPFPTVAQNANGIGWYTSDTASAATRSWVVISDGDMLYVLIAPSSASTNYQLYEFGGLVSYKAGDAYATIVGGYSLQSSGANSAGIGGLLANLSATTAMSFNFVARLYNQLGSAITVGAAGDLAISSGLGTGGFPYPAPEDNGFYVAKIRAMDSALLTNGWRGEIPGLYQPLHSRPLASGDTVENITGLSGKTLQAWLLNGGSSGTSLGQAAFDLTGPWR